MATRRSRRRLRWQPARPSPAIELGRTSQDGIAASMYALLDRGISRRPEVARLIEGTVLFDFEEGFAPLLVRFGPERILVSDEDLDDPDLRVLGPLPGVIHFATAPQLRGIPNPVRVKGRAALASFASGRVRVEGDLGIARKLVRLLAL